MKIYLVSSDEMPSKEQEETLKSLGDFNFIQGVKLSAKELIEKAKDAEILVAGPAGLEAISDELLAGLPNLKFISLLSVGTDWVDLEAAKKRNIPISNVKGANSEAVAEHTWGMILSLAKRISEFDRDTREQGIYNYALYKGVEMYGKTLGVVGLGDIGTKVARITKGFDMKVIGTNRSNNPVPNATLVPFEQLLKESDVIAVCVPLTKETENLIGEKEIGEMKQNVILVNCARPEVVNKAAVLKAIESKKLFGYGIETKVMEPIPQDDEYFKYPNVLVTVHNAFYTYETEIKVIDTVIQNIRAFLQGSPQNLV